MSTAGGVQYTGDTMSMPGSYNDESGGYHEYSRGVSVYWGIS